MSKVIKKNGLKNVHLHIDKAYKVIEGSLPRNYVELTKEKLPEALKSTSGQNIRNVKNRFTKYPISRLYILVALVEVAKDYQRAAKSLEQTLSN